MKRAPVRGRDGHVVEREVASAPVLRENGGEAFAIETPKVDLVAGGLQRAEGFGAGRGMEACGEGMAVEIEDTHRGSAQE